MSIVLDGTNGITTPDIDSTAGFDATALTSDIAAARITSALNATGDAPIYACRAWVNFAGSGTVTIYGSGNVSSITDNGTGAYVVNLTTAMPDVNYAIQHGVGGSSAIFKSRVVSSNVTSSTVGIETENDSDAPADSPYVYVSVFR